MVVLSLHFREMTEAVIWTPVCDEVDWDQKSLRREEEEDKQEQTEGV